jgi:hypothetical protein
MKRVEALFLSGLCSLLASACTTDSDMVETSEMAISPSAIVARQCSSFVHTIFGDVRGCVQQDDLGAFKAVAEVMVGTQGEDVTIDLELCRGNITACNPMLRHAQGNLKNHAFIATPSAPGAHGHVYRAIGGINGFRPEATSPFIAFP